MTIQETTARIEQITPLTDSILHLVLSPEHYIDYQAGQYLQVILEDTALYYSIANAPLGSQKYELHIRHSRDNPADQRLLEEIKQKGYLTLRLPFGECSLAHINPAKSTLFIAAGTGFAPVHAMIEQLLVTPTEHPFELIWGARTESDLYLDEKVKKWQNHVHRFRYTSLLTQHSQQTLASIVLSQHEHHLHQWQMILSGPFDLVYNTRDKLVENGVALEDLYSDAFQFEDKI